MGHVPRPSPGGGRRSVSPRTLRTAPGRSRTIDHNAPTPDDRSKHRTGVASRRAVRPRTGTYGSAGQSGRPLRLPAHQPGVGSSRWRAPEPGAAGRGYCPFRGHERATGRRGYLHPVSVIIATGLAAGGVSRRPASAAALARVPPSRLGRRPRASRRVGIGLDLPETRNNAEGSLLGEHAQHQRPLVLARRVVVRVVVDGNLEHGPVRPSPVRLPTPVLVEKRGVESALREPVADETPRHRARRSRRPTDTNVDDITRGSRLGFSAPTATDHSRPACRRICKLGVAGSSPARSIPANGLNMRFAGRD